jgi:hypothetical protein
MEATFTPDGLIISQQRYILDLLQNSNMSEAKPVKTPMSTAHALSFLSGDSLTDPSPYRSLVRALQYLSITRPDISFAINKISQFMHRPISLHLQTVKRILRYLKSTISYGLLLRRSSNNGQLPIPVLNMNIAPLLPLPLNSSGFNPCCATLVSFFPPHQHSGVTTLGPPIYLQIPPSMLAPNTLKLTFTSFVTKSPPKSWLFASSPTKTTLLISLPNPLPYHTLLSYAPSSTWCSLCLACGGAMNHLRRPHLYKTINHKTLLGNSPHKAHNG